MDLININREEQDIILSLQTASHWRELSIKLGSQQFVLRNEVSEICAVAFDSKQDTIVNLQRHIDKAKSIPLGIESYIKSKKNELTIN